jgi:phosphopantothenoylcysteine decarboxylase/phosphopantothenate--cysteine ligase
VNKGDVYMLENKNIVVGITGGIAAYKTATIINILKKEGANVHVIMTKSATEFITPLTIRTLSKNPVVTDMFKETDVYEVEHISLATLADLFVVVPATANIIGKVAHGIADDMLSTTIMATKAQVIFAPAMNENMYINPIVQDNIERLKQYGYKFIEPQSGMLACGKEGIGKLADTSLIIDEIKNYFRGDQKCKK